MAQKLFVNNTTYQIDGVLTVRAGSTPGNDAGTVNFTLTPGPGTEQMVEYGSPENPYVDQLELSAETDGAVIVSDQVVIVRSSTLDNDFNMNDTIYVTMQGETFVPTFANTWTV